jgi:hypothetical protein
VCVCVCFSREIMWLRLYCARAEQEGWAAAVAKLLLNLSRCSYFFPHCCDSNFTFTHTHCLLAAGYLSHSRGARYLGARSLCTLKPSTNNTHPAATIYMYYILHRWYILVLLSFFSICSTMAATPEQLLFAWQLLRRNLNILDSAHTALDKIVLNLFNVN